MAVFSYPIVARLAVRPSGARLPSAQRGALLGYILTVAGLVALGAAFLQQFDSTQDSVDAQTGGIEVLDFVQRAHNYDVLKGYTSGLTIAKVGIPATNTFSKGVSSGASANITTAQFEFTYLFESGAVCSAAVPLVVGSKHTKSATCGTGADVAKMTVQTQ